MAPGECKARWPQSKSAALAVSAKTQKTKNQPATRVLEAPSYTYIHTFMTYMYVCKQALAYTTLFSVVHTATVLCCCAYCSGCMAQWLHALLHQAHEWCPCMPIATTNNIYCVVAASRKSELRVQLGVTFVSWRCAKSCQWNLLHE